MLRVLSDSGSTPSSQAARGTESPWRKLIWLHMNAMVACDFFIKSVITPLGTKLAYQLIFD